MCVMCVLSRSGDQSRMLPLSLCLSANLLYVCLTGFGVILLLQYVNFSYSLDQLMLQSSFLSLSACLSICLTVCLCF